MWHGDFHTHTTFSDGISSMERMVHAAISAGLSSVGFTDHSYTPFDTRYCMPEDRIPEYLAEIRRLRDAYRGRIEIYAGLEWDGGTDLPQRDSFDYLIGDCHYVPTPAGPRSVDHEKQEQKDAIDRFFGGDAVAYSAAYYDGYLAKTRLHRPDVLGHFDLPVKFGFVDEDSPKYRNAALTALLACLEITPFLEINTGAVARGLRDRPYPADFLLKEALAHGARPVLCSDAHRPEHLGFGFREAEQRLASVGFHTLWGLCAGRWQEFPITGK